MSGFKTAFQKVFSIRFVSWGTSRIQHASGKFTTAFQNPTRVSFADFSSYLKNNAGSLFFDGVLPVTGGVLAVGSMAESQSKYGKGEIAPVQHALNMAGGILGVVAAPASVFQAFVKLPQIVSSAETVVMACAMGGTGTSLLSLQYVTMEQLFSNAKKAPNPGPSDGKIADSARSTVLSGINTTQTLFEHMPQGWARAFSLLEMVNSVKPLPSVVQVSFDAFCAAADKALAEVDPEEVQMLMLRVD